MESGPAEPRRLRRLTDKLAALGHRPPFWALAATMVLVLALLVAYAASRPQGWRPAVLVTPTKSPVVTPPPEPAPTPTPAPPQPELAQAIAGIEAQYNTSIGLAIAPIASPGQVTTEPWVGGTLTTSLAWQTIDIPVGFAVASGANQPADLAYLLDKSIAQNSDAGDEALWQFLGTPDVASASTAAVLAATGDETTTIPSGSSADGASVFSSVWWTNADAAQFMGVFFCMSASWPVVSHLQPAGDDTVFGLATLPNALVRTGSGNPDSLITGITVRQVGLLTLADGGRVGVSLSAMADDGTLETAGEAMTAVAALLPSLTGFDSRTC